MTTTTAGAPAMTSRAQTPRPRTLADLRDAAGLSQKQVGDRMGVNYQRVGQIEARYPNVNYGTLLRYIEAIGGSVQFTVATTHVYADQLIPDPVRAGTRAYLNNRPGKGSLVYVPVSAAEELPLQGDQSQPGGDDPGGQVDHSDAQGDQRDGGQRQQT